MAELTREQFDELYARYEAGTIDEAGLAALEPYRARRAVLLASGLGSRMLPVTETTPKPLVKVNGRRIIDSLLDALMAIGVDEIYVVVGYLKEQFEQLKDDYDGIRLIENPVYDITNNISSAVAAADHFQNAYAFESDLLLTNPGLLKKYRYESCYLGVPVSETPDWCFDTEAGYITDLHKGGTSCHHMYGISYWTAADGARLAEDLPKAFELEEYKQRFWDDVPCVLFNDRYRIAVQECTFDDIAEIDSFEELAAIDPSYRA